MLHPNSIEPNPFSQELQQMLARGRAGCEAVPNFVKVLSKSRAAAMAYALASGSLAEGQITERQREQIALAVAEINGSEYCLLAHSRAGGNAGLSGQEIESARRAAASDAKSAQMLRFTQSVVLQRGEISDDDLGALRKAGFSDAEMIEIVANIALNIFANYLNILARTGPDSPSVENGHMTAAKSAPIAA
jgi:uncharacterized peroxidase-related enzyme